MAVGVAQLLEIVISEILLRCLIEVACVALGLQGMREDLKQRTLKILKRRVATKDQINLMKKQDLTPFSVVEMGDKGEDAPRGVAGDEKLLAKFVEESLFGGDKHATVQDCEMTFFLLFWTSNSPRSAIPETLTPTVNPRSTTHLALHFSSCSGM